VESLVAAGVSSIVVGLETLGALSELPELVRAAGSIPVRFSLDLRNGQPVGRFTAPPPSPLALAAQAASAGAAATIVLDLARVGAESGPAHLDLIATLKARLGHPVYHGGGVRHAADLDALAAAGCDGALVGTALHSGRLGPRYCTTGNR
jgi:phosphoribosylformimino-5-aminoimidazole carboxamide ribotide isomerase